MAKKGSSFIRTDKFYCKDDQEQRLSAKAGFHGNKQLGSKNTLPNNASPIAAIRSIVFYSFLKSPNIVRVFTISYIVRYP